MQFRDSLEEEGFHRLKSGILGVAPGPGPGQALFEGECPYRGLQAFQPEHTAFIAGFGTPDENRFLAVVGASGSGKFSLNATPSCFIVTLDFSHRRGSDGNPRQWPGRQGNDFVSTLPFYPFEIRANGFHVVIELLRVVFAGLPYLFNNRIFHISLQRISPVSRSLTTPDHGFL